MYAVASTSSASFDNTRSSSCRTRLDSALRYENMSPSISTRWFPANQNLSTPWPPIFTFDLPSAASGHGQSRRSSRASPADAMEGIIPGTHTRSTKRPIPNRAVRAHPVIVPTTPPGLWRQVPEPKALHAAPTEVLPGIRRCVQAPIGSERPRPLSPALMHVVVTPHSSPDGAPNVPSSSFLPLPPSPRRPRAAPPPLLAQESLHDDHFNHLWTVEKRKNPYLPLVVSHLNPLRELVPLSFWKSVDTEGNYKKPLLSPHRRPKRSRKVCDATAGRLSTKSFLEGKCRHCTACRQDTLRKRLLVSSYWASRDDYYFEAAFKSWVGADGRVGSEDGIPQDVVIEDRDDFDDEDDEDAIMDDVPLIIEKYPGNYTTQYLC